MNTKKENAASDNHVCTVGHLRLLDNFLRKKAHNPKKLFGKYIKEGMDVIDIGCGSGFASIGFAGMVGEGGKVIAADLQEDMLSAARRNAEKAGVKDKILFHKCQPARIGYSGKVDFALAFFMVHETPDIPGLLNEVYSILKDNGLFFISEHNFYVSREEFGHTVDEALKAGFKIHSYPKVVFGKNIILQKL